MFLPLLFAFLLTCFVYKRVRHMTALKRNGILGPKPNLITGNFFTHLSKPNVPKAAEYAQDYGKISGYYLGRNIVVNVLDLELIKEIQVKNFSQFPTKGSLGSLNTDSYRRMVDATSQNVYYMESSKFKEAKQIMGATFSPAKIKSMTPVMSSSVDVLLDKVGRLTGGEKGGEFDIYPHLQLFTTDVMCKVALGVDENLQNNPQHPAFQAVKRLFTEDQPNRLVQGLSMVSELDPVLKPIRSGIQLVSGALNLYEDDSKQVADYIGAIMDHRLASSQPKRDDFLQEMLDSNELSPGEKISNISYFYASSSETESTALAFAVHFLVNFPDIQDRVRAEIQEVVFQNSNGKFDYDSMSRLTYLQAVLLETLRYYPVFTNFVKRVAKVDFAYGDIVLPKGATVSVPVHQLHHTEEYWPKPEVFDPDRFQDKSAANSPAFQAFGGGPRVCPGMRFALFEMKLVLARLLTKYRLVPGESTEQELTLTYRTLTQTPTNGVWLKAIPIV